MSARTRTTCPHGLDTWTRRRLIFCGLLVVVLLMSREAIAQQMTTPALKAAFIYNFVRFTEWPSVTPASDPFVSCVIGDAAVGDALERLVVGREFQGRRMVVLTSIPRPAMACRVLYVSGTTLSDAERAIAGLQDSPVLTISDLEGFTARGGMTQFYAERGRMRFWIELDAVRRSGLKMSSQLLALARRPR